MWFQILEVVLWPRNEASCRRIPFERGCVNIIHGTSMAGKSAIVPIIDYCLGSDKCLIPVGHVRDACSWFGVVIETSVGQKLLARREPGEKQSSGDMFFLEGKVVNVPERKPVKNANVDHVKDVLNKLAGLPGLDIVPGNPGGYLAAPSFRDLVSFMFQPQNVVANPNVLFYKADSTDHRAKLRNIFPLILGAIDNETLQNRWRLQKLRADLRKSSKRRDVGAETLNQLSGEINGWLRSAVELGLLPADVEEPKTWTGVIRLFQQALRRADEHNAPTADGIQDTVERINYLREQERTIGQQLSSVRRQYAQISRLIKSGREYEGSIGRQKERLEIVNWLRTLHVDQERTLKELENMSQPLSQLMQSLNEVEFAARGDYGFFDDMSAELARLYEEIERLSRSLRQIRDERFYLEAGSSSARDFGYRLDQVQRFVGRMQEAMRVYRIYSQDIQDDRHIRSLKERIAEVSKKVDEKSIQAREKEAISEIETYLKEIVPKLPTEYGKDIVSLTVKHLSLTIKRGNNEYYLWETGSGANWVSLHVAITLALQRFFLARRSHSVPNVLVYDQPSQVFFPGLKDVQASGSPEEVDRREDVDRESAKKIFKTIGQEVVRARGSLQVIIMDHAGSDVWGGIEGVELKHDWSLERLIPADWPT